MFVPCDSVNLASLALDCLPGECAKANAPMSDAMIETVLVSCAWGEDVILQRANALILQRVEALGRMRPYEFPSPHWACPADAPRRMRL